MIDEDARRRFERAWLQGQPPAIDDCLPNRSDPHWLPTLQELVCIDLEFAWKAWQSETHCLPSRQEVNCCSSRQPPLIEAYVQRYPALRERKVLERLVRHEVEVRRAIGDACVVADYGSRFPELGLDDGQRNVPHLPGYIVESELGRGGMGVVYRCCQSATDQRVALKLLLPARTAGFESLARFRIEAEALACLDHPNISRVMAVGVAGRCPFIVTEFASNGTLRNHVVRHRKTVDWCVDAIRQAALGMQHAHSRSMIHRDIKPANILVMEDETPKVTDFGLVKFQSRIRDIAEASRAPQIDASFCNFDLLLHDVARQRADASMAGDLPPPDLVRALRGDCLARTGLPDAAINLTTIEQFLETVIGSGTGDETADDPAVWSNLDDLTGSQAWLGSPQFMSPEQVIGDSAAIGPQTDIYSLGATLYYLLSGVPVASGDRLAELFHNIRNKFPQPLQELNPDVPTSVDCVVWKAIQKDAPRRYESCEQLANELQCCLDGRKPAAQQSRERWLQQTAAERSAPAKRESLFRRMFRRKRN